MNLGLAGKTAIVTGGSRGIGQGIARALIGEGVKVAICARGEEALRQAAEEIGALSIPADTGRADHARRLVKTATEAFGQVDILVNAAADSHSAELDRLTDEDWLGDFNVKFLGYVRTAREVLPGMRERGWGRIVNIAGVAARTADLGYTSGAINIALVNLTKKLALDAAPFGITVNAIHPGAVRTQRREAALARAMERQGLSRKDAERAAVERIPIGRLIEVGDIADAVLFLASERASAITGQVLTIDGGADRGVHI